MSTARQHELISVADYLVGEHDALHKHEFVEGVEFLPLEEVQSIE